MKTIEIQRLANDFLNGGADRPEVTRIDRNQLYDTMGGCAYWTEKHYITKEMLLRHLNYQCSLLNGGIDENELNDCLNIFKKWVIQI